MNNYEQMCLELDNKLAELLGYTHINPDCTFAKSPKSYGHIAIIRWTKDDGEAFRLMVEHEIKVHVNKTWDEVIANHTVLDTRDYPTEKAALRVAIVKAVIAKLSQ